MVRWNTCPSFLHNLGHQRFLCSTKIHRCRNWKSLRLRCRQIDFVFAASWNKQYWSPPGNWAQQLKWPHQHGKWVVGCFLLSWAALRVLETCWWSTPNPALKLMQRMEWCFIMLLKREYKSSFMSPLVDINWVLYFGGAEIMGLHGILLHNTANQQIWVPLQGTSRQKAIMPIKT